jgi:hypothetical protein
VLCPQLLLLILNIGTNARQPSSKPFFITSTPLPHMFLQNVAPDTFSLQCRLHAIALFVQRSRQGGVYEAPRDHGHRSVRGLSPVESGHPAGVAGSERQNWNNGSCKEQDSSALGKQQGASLLCGGVAEGSIKRYGRQCQVQVCFACHSLALLVQSK